LLRMMNRQIQCKSPLLYAEVEEDMGFQIWYLSELRSQMVLQEVIDYISQPPKILPQCDCPKKMPANHPHRLICTRYSGSSPLPITKRHHTNDDQLVCLCFCSGWTFRERAWIGGCRRLWRALTPVACSILRDYRGDSRS
jgi:hypothetical protein